MLEPMGFILISTSAKVAGSRKDRAVQHTKLMWYGLQNAESWKALSAAWINFVWNKWGAMLEDSRSLDRSMLPILHTCLLSPPLLSSIHSEGLTYGLLLIKQSRGRQPTWLQSAQKNKNKWSDKMTRQRPLLQSEYRDGWLPQWSEKCKRKIMLSCNR